MSILEIITEPNPLLHQVSRDVEEGEFGQELVDTLSSMAETMYATGGVGLAAPQVGDFRRIVVADLGYAEAAGDGKIAGKYGSKLIKMINPKILSGTGEFVGLEGCLSVPGFEQKVSRNNAITVEFLDENFERQKLTFDGFIAVIIQHEIDHLDGITLLTRAGKLKRSRYLKRVKGK